MSKITPFNLFIRQCLLYPLTSPFLPPENKVEKDYSYAAGTKTGTLEAGVAGGLPKTGQTAVIIAGDDGTYQKGYPAAGDRYTDNGDGTITDNATGLMWVKDGSGAGCNNGAGGTLAAAIAFCEALDFAGHTDWRLPNIKELMSIAHYGIAAPTIHALFTNTVSDKYCSSTSKFGETIKVWTVNFATGLVDYAFNFFGYYIRPVRLG
jgi:hypothetical protein